MNIFKSIKSALTSRSLYQEGYKKLRRWEVIRYVIVISLAFAVFSAPINTYRNVKDFIYIKEQISKIPPKLEIKYNTQTGLTTNINNPYVLNTAKETILVLDPNNKYTEHDKNTDEIIFREKGFVVYSKGKLIDQNSYSNFILSDFNITGKDLKNTFENTTISEVITIAIIFNLLANFLGALSNIAWMTLIFGGLAFLLTKYVLRKDTTFFLQVKRILLLSVFVVLGMALNVLFFEHLPFADIMLFGGAYFFLIRN